MEQPPLEIIGTRIRERRRAMGVSQEKFAQLAGLHRTYIWQVESGRHNLAVLNLLKIARALDVTAGELLDGIR